MDVPRIFGQNSNGQQSGARTSDIFKIQAQLDATLRISVVVERKQDGLVAEPSRAIFRTNV
jgi:hypothetical protein